jgi:hypothetical protein
MPLRALPPQGSASASFAIRAWWFYFIGLWEKYKLIFGFGKVYV